MAVQPLIVQTPRVSLIGGNQLQKASGQGVPTPDLTRGADQFLHTLERKNDENRALSSTIEGEKYYEAERASQKAAGIGVDGMYGELKPVPHGDHYFQTAYFDARAKAAASDIRTQVSSRFNTIQTDFTKPSSERVALMEAAAEGTINALDPLLRKEAREYVSREIEARTQSMANRDAELQWSSTVKAIDGEIEDETNKAFSASSSGADANPHKQAVMSAIDRKVALGIQSPEDGAREKDQLVQKVAAVGDLAAMTRDILNENTDLAKADNFAIVFKAGGEATMEAQEAFEVTTPPAGPDERGPGTDKTVQIGNRTVWSTSELKKKYSDPEVQQAIAVRLQEVINFKQAQKKAHEEDYDLIAAMAAVAPTDNEIPAGYHDKMEKMFAKGLIEGKLDGDQGLAVAREITEATKYMTPTMRNVLLNAMTGRDYRKAVRAAGIWKQLSTANRGGTQIGTMIRNKMNSEDVTAMDLAAQTLDSMVGEGDASSQQRWSENVKTLIRDPKAVNDSITQFNIEANDPASTTKQSFNSQVQTLFTEKYGTGNMPREMLESVRVNFHLQMTGSVQAPTREDALAKAWEATSSNWQQNSIYYGGFQPTHNVIANPPGYSTKVMRPGTPFLLRQPDNAWLRDYTLNIIGKVDDANALIFDDPEDRDQFDLITAHPFDAMGTNAGQLSLKAVSPGQSYTQFYVVMTGTDSSQTLLMTRNAKGETTPLVLDPAIVNAHLQAKAESVDAVNQLTKDFQRARATVLDPIYSRMTGIPTDPSGITTGEWDPKAIEAFVLTLSPEDKARYQLEIDSSAKQFQKAKAAYEAKVPTVPTGVDIAPELLSSYKVGGEAVTIAAVQQINSVLPMPDGGQFLLDTASAESDYGKAGGTFRASGDRGIFQINDGTQGAYREVKRRANIEGDPIQVAAAKLKAIGIDVANANPTDLDKPNVSAAFARLYYMADPRPWPTNVAEAGEFWKDHYNTHLGAGSVRGFVSKAGRVTMPDTQLTSTGPGTAFITPAYADSGGGAPGAVVDMSGKSNPANFLAMRPAAQSMAIRLSSSFGAPIRITPHGGTQGDARKSTSQHHSGTAIDIYVADMSDADKARLISTAIALGYKGIGGYGAGDGKGTIHLDLRQNGGRGPNGLAVWWRHQAGVDSAYTTAPMWFQQAINSGSSYLDQRNA